MANSRLLAGTLMIGALGVLGITLGLTFVKPGSGEPAGFDADASSMRVGPRDSDFGDRTDEFHRVEVADGNALLDREFEGTRGYSLQLRGTVVDSETGTGIPEAEVALLERDVALATATSDAVGAFRIQANGPSAAFVCYQVNAAGYAPFEALAANSSDTVVVLSRRRPIRVQVRNLATDAPIAHATVRQTDLAGMPRGPVHVADGNGVVAFDGRAESGRLLVRAPGFVLRAIDESAADGADELRVIHLSPSAEHRLRIVGPTGADVESPEFEVEFANRFVRIAVESRRFDGATVWHVRPSDRGLVRITAPCMAATTVQLDAVGSDETKDIELAEGWTAQFRLELVDPTLTGTVWLCETPYAIDGDRWPLFDRREITHGEIVRCTGLAFGKDYRLRVAAPGLRTHELVLREEQGCVHDLGIIALDERSDPISIRVVTSDDEPIAGARFSVDPAEGTWFSDAAGECALTLPFDAATLAIEAAGKCTRRIPIGSLDAELNVIRLEDGATIRGTVVDQFGLAVPFAEVSASADDGSQKSVRADGSGSFVLEGLCQPACDLTAKSTDSFSFKSKTGVKTGSDVRLTVERIGTVVVRVDRSDPRSECKLSWDCEGVVFGRYLPARVDVESIVMPAGTRFLSVGEAGGDPIVKPVEVPPGGRVDVNVVMRSVQVVPILVTNAEGAPRAGARLDLYCAGDTKGLVRVSEMTTDSDGRAEASVVPGRYRAVLRGVGAKNEAPTAEFDVAGSNEIRLIIGE